MDACMVALVNMVQLCSHVGTLNLKSLYGCLPVYHNWVDTIDQEAKLPDDKYAALLSQLLELRQQL